MQRRIPELHRPPGSDCKIQQAPVVIIQESSIPATRLGMLHRECWHTAHTIISHHREVLLWSISAAHRDFFAALQPQSVPVPERWLTGPQADSIRFQMQQSAMRRER